MDEAPSLESQISSKPKLRNPGQVLLALIDSVDFKEAFDCKIVQHRPQALHVDPAAAWGICNEKCELIACDDWLWLNEGPAR